MAEGAPEDRNGTSQQSSDHGIDTNALAMSANPGFGRDPGAQIGVTIYQRLSA